ncbi:TonB-dependent receptor plug domain-containing protein [Caulobacter segnis]
MVAFDAFDVERIEVLKGPQGTLYGRNVVGGAVNVVSKRPSPSGFDAGVEATAGNYDRFEGAGFVNAPFSSGKPPCGPAPPGASTTATSTTPIPAGRWRTRTP